MPVPRRRPVDADGQLLSIGQLAAQTGVATATLRSWEQRLGFPEPVRTSGGQRRYRSIDVERVHAVVAERGRGLTLAAAVRAATRGDQAAGQSLFARLRGAHPQLEPIRVGMRVMKALSWSVEDECLAHASRPLVYGCFQTAQTYRSAGRRWRELARTAAGAVVFSDFEATDQTSTPARVALPRSSPMLNEWSLVCLDQRLSVVLVAWEPPPTGESQGSRRFEGLLSLEPEVVRDAALHCAMVCTDLGVPELTIGLTEHLEGLAEDPRRTAALLRRFATYADG